MKPEPMALGPKSFFEQILPTALAEKAKKGSLPSLVASFAVVGEQAGSWTLRCEPKSGEVVQGAAADATLRFTLSDLALTHLLSGKLDAKAALESGAVTIAGDWSALPKLSSVFTEAWNMWSTS